MASRLDKPASTNQAQPIGPAGPEHSAKSQHLVDEIRDHLQRLEETLSVRGQQLAQTERGLREARAALETERGEFSRQRAAMERHAAEKLKDYEKRLENQARALDDREKQIQDQAGKQRELIGRIETLTQERARADGECARLRGQIEQHQHRLQQVEAELARQQRESVVREQRAAEVAAATAAQGPSPERPASGLLAAPRRTSNWWYRLNPVQRASVGVGAIALVIMSVALGGSALAREKQVQYRITGVVLTPPGDAKTLKACAKLGEAHRGLRMHRDTAAGVLELSLEATERSAGESRMDRITGAIAAQVSPPELPRSSSRPAQSGQAEERRRRLEHLREIEGRLAGIKGPRASPGEARSVAVSAAWETAKAQRKEIGASLAELEAQLTSPPPDESMVRVDSARVKEAQLQDRRLQTDLEALRQREAELAATLAKMVKAGDAEFKTLSRATADGDVCLAQALEAAYGDDVDKALGTMREALLSWGTASAALAEVWHEQRQLLARAEAAADPLASQAGLSRAARTFIEETGASLAVFRTGLAAVGQGSGETTKRLVLQRALTRDLQKTVNAREAVAALARSVLLTENLDLATMAQRATNLRSEVQDQRSRIEAAVRQRALEDLRGEHERWRADARAEHDRLCHLASQLDQAMSTTGDEAMALITRLGTGQSTTIEMAELYRERGDTLEAIAALDEAAAGELAEAETPIEIRRLPAHAVELPRSFGWKLGRVLAAGASPLLAALALGGLMAAVQAFRRSRRSMETYARALQAASRRTTGDKR